MISMNDILKEAEKYEEGSVAFQAGAQFVLEKLKDRSANIYLDNLFEMADRYDDGDTDWKALRSEINSLRKV